MVAKWLYLKRVQLSSDICKEIWIRCMGPELVKKVHLGLQSCGSDGAKFVVVDF